MINAVLLDPLRCPTPPPPDSPQVRKGDFIINSSTNKRVRVPRLVRIHSDELEDIEAAVRGGLVKGLLEEQRRGVGGGGGWGGAEEGGNAKGRDGAMGSWGRVLGLLEGWTCVMRHVGWGVCAPGHGPHCLFAWRCQHCLETTAH